MQNIFMYLRVEGIKAIPVDLYNKKLSALPAVAKNMDCIVRLRLLQSDGITKYDSSEFDGITSWYFVMADDWNPATAAHVKVFAVTLDATDDYTDLLVSMTAAETNTQNLIDALATEEFIQEKCELGGIKAGETTASACLQFEMNARNRLEDTADPTELPETYLNAEETLALVQAAPDREYSVDGATLWHSTQVAADRYYREQRNGGEWSDPIALVEPTDAFVYVAYASDNSGTDWNLTPSDSLKYRAEIHSITELTPVESDFSGATWVKYIGDSITGETGPAGQDAFVYVAYASDNSGTDWNLTPSDSLKYRAEIHSITELTPVESDFSGASWVKYLGDNADGTTPQGEYNSGTTYVLNNGVTYNGSYYRSLAADNTGNQPDSSPTYWELTVEKGDTGATGPEVKHIIKDVSALASGTITLDAYKDIYTITVTTDTTFTFDVSNLGDLTDKVVTFELHIDMTTVSTITFPASASWIDEPLMNVIGKYVLVFRSDDGGTSWLGNLAYEVLS